MKRRDFGLLAGAGATAAVTAGATVKAQAASADPALLTTTLTPLGAERAGNADGSIPAWTGGMVGDPSAPIDIKVFEGEQKLLTVDAGNLAQHQALVTPGMQAMIQNYGFSLNVFPTHRTAAAAQYMYDNTAKNVTRAQFSPQGGRFGFTGAYGGVPFPIIDTSDPLVAGPQLIWNHLTAWSGFCSTTFTPGFVMTDGQLVMSAGDLSRFRHYYYDPDGSPDTFDGYFLKTHVYFKAPAAFNGQEVVTWNSVNTLAHPDIVWTLLNGQGRVRKAPDEQYDSPNSYFNGVYNFDENSAFQGDPSQYDWKYIAKQEMYIPYHCNDIVFATADKFFTPKGPNPDLVRWEKHRVWVVEATLHPGNRNVLARRRFYIDEDTWNIAVGEAYDQDGNMDRVYMQFIRAMPAVPCTSALGFFVLRAQTGEYAFAGFLNYPPFTVPTTKDIVPEEIFNPQQMAANASF